MPGTDTLTLTAADDFHVHLRQGDTLRQVVPLVRAGGVGRCLVMPNTTPPVRSTVDAMAYRAQLAAIEPHVTFLMALYLTPDLTPDEISRAADAGVVAVKCYPRGVTTNSEAGVEDLTQYRGVFAAMQERGLVLCLHGESPSDAARGICVLNAEERFLPEVDRLHAAFPRLKIVLEHVSTAAAVERVRRWGPTVAATITPQHLCLTVDDWAGRNHHYCKPVAKYPADRDALCAAVREGHPKFFLGSDSAPHPRAAKECAQARGGVFCSPLLLPYLADRFDELGCLDRLPAFATRFGREFYGLPALDQTVTLVRRPIRVPDCYGDIVPLYSGRTLRWRL